MKKTPQNNQVSWSMRFVCSSKLNSSFSFRCGFLFIGVYVLVCLRVLTLGSGEISEDFVCENRRYLLSIFSYALSREYRVAGFRYSRLVFTSEDRLCANLNVQWQSMNMTKAVSSVRVTSQVNCGDVTMLSQKGPSLATMAKSAIDNCFWRNYVFRTYNSV